ncbi:uncharacterized protein LOC143853485 isoform X2 [Tasmannia lanceolata]
MVGKGQSLEGMAYKVSVSFPIDYPIEPPNVKFKTLCFHPNVDLYGSVCWDILQTTTRGNGLNGYNVYGWKGTITGRNGLQGLCFLSIDYPIEPPKVKFKTLCFHPIVDLYGSVCWDILQVFWKLDFLESSVRMRRCLRRNYERSDYLAAAANSGDHLLQLKHHLSYK